MNHHARFELRQDEDTGRRYWWGSEDGWKDATEIGEDGVLMLDAQHFAIGSVLTLTEPSCVYCAAGDDPFDGLHYFYSPNGQVSIKPCPSY